MFFIFPAHSSHQLFLFMPPAGAFLLAALFSVSDSLLFASGRWLSFNSPFCVKNVPPAAHFSQQLEKWAKEPPDTDGFWTSFCVQELLPKFRRSRESAFFYSRCRYIGWLKGVVLLPGESILPSGRTTSFFIWAGAAAGLLLSQFPRHLISNETLEGKGNPKTIGFCWRSLVPFCPEANTHHFSRIFLCFFR